MIAVLFVRKDSIYKTMIDVDAWDKDRDARKWPGGSSVVAHPPCAQWGALSHFANDVPHIKALAPWAVEQVRRWGGVLEHPRSSKLWAHMKLPKPGHTDAYGGFTFPVFQQQFGHEAQKSTFLYIVGTRDLPPVPLVLGEALKSIGHPAKGVKRRRPELSKPDREHTPAAFAAWLVDLARRCSTNTSGSE